MTTKTVKVVFEQLGENSTTAKDPVRIYKGEEIDLNATIGCCLSYDDDRLVQCQKYAIVDVELPEWLDPEFWLRNQVQFKYLWSIVGKDCPERIQRALLPMGMPERMGCWNLLKVKNFRSDFRRSLRAQLDAWIDTPAEARTHRSPFSPRQWECVVDARTARDASRLSNSVYYNR